MIFWTTIQKGCQVFFPWVSICQIVFYTISDEEIDWNFNSFRYWLIFVLKRSTWLSRKLHANGFCTPLNSKYEPITFLWKLDLWKTDYSFLINLLLRRGHFIDYSDHKMIKSYLSKILSFLKAQRSTILPFVTRISWKRVYHNTYYCLQSWCDQKYRYWWHELVPDDLQANHESVNKCMFNVQATILIGDWVMKNGTVQN